LDAAPADFRLNVPCGLLIVRGMTVAASDRKTMPLSQPVTALPGVGQKRSKLFARLEIATLEDLLLHRPLRYEDRRRFQKISELEQGVPVTTRGTIVAMGVKWFSQHTKSIFEIILDDGTARLYCRWWNMGYMEKYFKVGEELVVFGKPMAMKPRTMDHPETETIAREEFNIHLGRIVPVYPLTEGMSQNWLRALIWRTLEQQSSSIEDSVPGLAQRTTSEPEYSRLSRAQAIRCTHFPEDFAEVEPARQRLALDEFVGLQRQIVLRRRNFETKSTALLCSGDNRLIKPFLARLSFRLTAAQTSVLRELRKDMAGAHPMRRLLQGDVGSGKTAVAGACALMALESGYNVALMAPTEILAGQHYRTFTNWLAPLGVRVELQTGQRKTTAERNSKSGGSDSAASSAATGPMLFIGTHALFTEGFEIPRLGLVIIDEQHKFGVAQRDQLLRKGHYPHLLVMTATPIPRTLGLTVYGELDLSVITEAPGGRGQVKTFVRTTDKLPKLWAFLKQKLAAGRQAYVVYPLIEEASAGGIKGVTKEFAGLQTLLAPYRVGLLHGRLRSAEKESVMAAFHENQVQVLLATSLIEVGVDVPNATVMLVENAERFGLAQLHQLRGRIGRGVHDSYCILVTVAGNAEAQKRLQVLADTNDGFRIAEADLKLRGPGDLVGRQQSGMPRFRFGDLAKDLELIRLARQIAEEPRPAP
jgi:ATP-dependent DNA helicase RecG